MSNIKVERGPSQGGSIKSALLQSWWHKNTLTVTKHGAREANIEIKGSMHPRIVEWADLKEWAEALVEMAEENMSK